MKKFFLSTVIVIMIVSLSYHAIGQEFAITGGLNYTEMKLDLENEDSEPATKLKEGIHLGLKLSFPLQGSLLLQTGIGYSEKGYEYDLEKVFENAESIEGYARRNLNYVVIPFNLAFGIKPIRVFAGPYLGIGFSGNQEHDFTLTYDGEEEQMDDSYDVVPAYGTMSYEDLEEDEEAFNGIDYGFNFGIGLHFGALGFTASMSQGLNNVIPKMEYAEGDDNSEYRDNNSLTNTVYQFSVSLALSSLK